MRDRGLEVAGPAAYRAAALLARELVEEQVEHVRAGALVRPDEAAAVVVAVWAASRIR